MAATQLYSSPKEPREASLNINEIFGPTIQGEGPHTGQLCSFVRVAGCNLSCSWCDTPYSWDWNRYDRAEESHKMSVEEIAAQVYEMKAMRVILTGGEPLMQQHSIPALKAALPGVKIDIETNGTRIPTEAVIRATDLFCVSPKLAHAGDPEERRLVPAALKAFAQLARDGQAFFKFVAQDVSDFDEIETFIEAGEIPASAVWIMPEGADPDTHLENLRKLADEVIARGWNLATRVHVIIWKTERGH